MNNEPFACAGCGRTTPAPSMEWTSQRTGKVSRYCFACDDLLIADMPLPLHELRARLARPNAGRPKAAQPKPSTIRARKSREQKNAAS